MGAWQIGAILVVASGGLIALFPGRQSVPAAHGPANDPLAVEYLRLLGDDQPGNARLRVDLAERLLALGRLDQARTVLERTLAQAAHGARDGGAAMVPAALLGQAGVLRLRIALADYQSRQAALSPTQGKQLLDEIGEGARALVDRPLAPAELARLAEVCRAINRNDLAATIYERLASEESSRSRHWLRRAATAHLAAGHPAKAALDYERLALGEGAAQPDEEGLEAIPDGGIHGRRQRLKRAAKTLAPRRPRRSGRLPPRVIAGRPTEPPPSSIQVADAGGRRDAIRALESFLASSTTFGPSVVVHAARAVARFPEDAEILELAIRIAQSQNAVEEARAWGRRLVALRPESAEENARQAARELAAGDPKAALPSLERVEALRPLDDRERGQLARVAEWAGRPEVALRAWAILARHHPLSPAMDAALLLAPELRDFSLEADLLGIKARSEKLADTEVKELGRVHEEVGRPEEAYDLLVEYAQHHPDQPAALRELAQLAEHRGDLAAALTHLEALAPRLDGGELLENARARADLMWRLHRPDDAFALLSGVVERTLLPSSATPETVARALAQLGMSLPASHDAGEEAGDDEEVPPLALLGQLLGAIDGERALPLYRRLFALHLLRRDDTERYVSIERHLGSEERAMAAAQEAYAHFGDPELLLAAMDLAEEGERHDVLRRLVAVAEGHEARFAESKDYWLDKASVAERDGRSAQARAAYERALRLDPESESARLSLLELLIDEVEREADRADRAGEGAAHATDARSTEARSALRRYLARWVRRARETEFNVPMATAYGLLGDTRRALRWYEREWRRQRPDRWGKTDARAITAEATLWLFEYAAALDRAGRRQQAQRVRKIALPAALPLAVAAAERLRRARANGRPATEERALVTAFVAQVRDAFGPGRGGGLVHRVIAGAPELRAVWRGPSERPDAPTDGAESDDAADDLGSDGETRLEAAIRHREERRFARVARHDEPALSDEPAAERPDADPELPARYWLVSGGYRFDTLDQLGIHTAAVAAELARPTYTLRLDAAYGHLVPWLGGATNTENYFARRQRIANPQRSYSLLDGQEADVGLSVEWRFRDGHLNFGVGYHALRGIAERDGVALAKLPPGCVAPSGQPSHSIDCQVAGDLPYTSLAIEGAPLHGVTIGAALRLNEVISDSPGLRYYGARDGLALSLDVDLTPREFVRAEATFDRYHDRRPSTVSLSPGCEGCMGAGYSVEAEVGHRFHLVNPEWDVHLAGAWFQNSLNPDYRPPYWQPTDLLPDPKPTRRVNGGNLTLAQQQEVLGRPIYDLLASTYAQVGVETSLHYGTPARGPGRRDRMRYEVDAWFGWLHSTQDFAQPNARSGKSVNYALATLDSPGFDLRASLGFGFPHGQELSLNAYVNNNRPLGQGLLYWGAGLRYLF